MGTEEERVSEIEQFIAGWQSGLEEKQALYIGLARAALVTRDPKDFRRASEAWGDWMRHLAAEGLNPPEGWEIISQS